VVLRESPIAIEREGAPGAVVFVCEHASCRLPEELGTLGLDDRALRSHIAWDIGALDLARGLADAVDGTVCYQRFSRLAYDCNRPPEASSAIVGRSETYDIPGNQGLDPAQRSARVKGIYLPFRDGLAALLERRQAAARATVLVTVHSFTPVYFGTPRQVEIGILHDSDTRLADAMLAEAQQMGSSFVVRRNEPYAPTDGVTHTLVEHGIKRGIPNVMIEVRNDLLVKGAMLDPVVEYISNMLNGAMSNTGSSSVRR